MLILTYTLYITKLNARGIQTLKKNYRLPATRLYLHFGFGVNLDTRSVH